MNRDKTKDRAQIQQEYVDWYVNGLSITDMMRQIADEMHDDLNMLDDKELVKELGQDLQPDIPAVAGAGDEGDLV